MVGLVPTIHALRRWGQATADGEARTRSIPRKGVDGRHKGDHDGKSAGNPSPASKSAVADFDTLSADLGQARDQ
jgi:hypothetical protein